MPKVYREYKKLYEDTGYAVMLSTGCNLFEGETKLRNRNMENFLCDTYLDKKGTGKLLDRLIEECIVFLSKIIECVGDYIDILMFGGDDLGSQNTLFMAPEVFAEIFKSRFKKM